MSKSKLKEILQADIDNVFMNTNEFSEVAIINGEEMEIILDNDMRNQSDTSKQLAMFDVLFHTKTINFEHIPQPEMLMKFNGEHYRIKNVSDNMGMITVGLLRVDSRQ